MALLHLDSPYPKGTLKLPGNGGIIHCCIKTLDQRSDGDIRVLLLVPSWSRWSTQVDVGEPAHEGIAPTVEEVWAPGFAVEVDDKLMDDLRERLEDLAS